MAHARDAALVAFTDSPLVPLARAALVVVASSAAGCRSLAATMVVALGLVPAIKAARTARR